MLIAEMVSFEDLNLMSRPVCATPMGCSGQGQLTFNRFPDSKSAAFPSAFQGPLYPASEFQGSSAMPQQPAEFRTRRGALACSWELFTANPPNFPDAACCVRRGSSGPSQCNLNAAHSASPLHVLFCAINDTASRIVLTTPPGVDFSMELYVPA